MQNFVLDKNVYGYFKRQQSLEKVSIKKDINCVKKLTREAFLHGLAMFVFSMFCQTTRHVSSLNERKGRENLRFFTRGTEKSLETGLANNVLCSIILKQTTVSLCLFSLLLYLRFLIEKSWYSLRSWHYAHASFVPFDPILNLSIQTIPTTIIRYLRYPSCARLFS